MTNYLVTSSVFDFEKVAQTAAEDRGPRHTIAMLGELLEAQIRQPDGQGQSLVDGLLGKLYPEARHWALARRLAPQLRDGDLVYCAGQDTGIPLALLKKRRRVDAVLGVHTMEPGSGRFAAFMKTFDLIKAVDLFTVNDQHKADLLRSRYGASRSQVCVLPEHTDREFFRPMSGTMSKSRPLIASAGLEHRDYVTLAEAIEGLDADLKVCAVSSMASKRQKVAMPDDIPANMEMRYYEFAELRDLYCSADIVVISLLANRVSAGLTVLMEAMACRRPIIITLNEGLPTLYSELGLVVGTRPDDPSHMRSAIQKLLENPDAARAMAQRAYEHFLQHHTKELFVERLSTALTSSRS